jgi:hypothetical protein
MKAELRKVAKAATLNTESLKEELRNFKDNMDQVKLHLKVEKNPAAEIRCAKLLTALEAEQEAISQAEADAKEAVESTQKFFGERNPVSSEAFCSQIMAVVRQLSQATMESPHRLERRPSQACFFLESMSTDVNAQVGGAGSAAAATTEALATGEMHGERVRRSSLSIHDDAHQLTPRGHQADVSWLADGINVSSALKWYNPVA